MKQQTSDERIKFLEDKIKMLEDENVGTTNALYEMENRLQSQIDALINYTMKLKQWEGEPNDIY
jgi:prefoldin subunit 5